MPPDVRAIPRAMLEKDAELARLGRCEAQLKLRIGELLDALFERGGHHELGFSSFEAYVVERCERSRSWGRETRALARRLRERDLPEMRRAIVSGRLSWSMAELLARHATHENETELLLKASQSTVRAMTSALTGKATDSSDDDDLNALKIRATHWVSENDLVMLHASRVLVEYLNGQRANDEELFTALLGEGETTLQSIEERIGASVDIQRLDASKFEALAAALRDARARNVRPSSDVAIAPPVFVEVARDLPLPETLRGIDDEIVHCCRELARRNLQIGRLFGVVLASKAWRALGYASPGQYAAERVGLSLSSLEHRVTLARRVTRSASLARAVDDGVIGYEAALLVSRVIGRWASDELVRAWIDRARRRTVKHLREDISAVLLAADLRSDTSRFPPGEDDLEAAFALERKIQSGELLRSYGSGDAARSQMSVTLATTSGSRRSLQLNVSADLYVHLRNVEAELRAVVGPEVSFIAFLCTSLWQTWLPFLKIWDDKWMHVYRRDRHRCTSPVCERHDVTPHHVRFQAHGGTDEPENMLSGCTWCHLEGIHRGRLRAEGTASNLTWTIGRDPILVVSGREKIIARAT